jgi:hypothetical protein
LHNTVWWDFTTGSGNGVIGNTASNLGRDTVATNYWTDLSLNNQIVNPLLTSISRTNFGAFLDPRPQPGSPALSNYAPTPAGLTQVSQQGAFGAGRGNWASDWTALSEYGIVGGAGGSNPSASSVAATVPSPNPVTLAIAPNGANLEITFASQSAYSYQLQSITNLDASSVWVDQGSAQTGTGSTLTNLVPTSDDVKYFRVKAN